MSTLAHRRHSDVLRETLVLEGARVADIGCGDGALVRLMARAGARVSGIEPSPAQLARARAVEPAGGEDYLQARAEALPLADAALDAVVFFNALHHVPVEAMGAALAEAARVLKPGGLLYAMEPRARGRYFELVRPVEDETLVRAKAHDALREAGAGPWFEQVRELCYEAPFKYASFETFRAGLLAVDQGRRARIEALEETLRAGFASAAEQRDGAYWFTQPSRLTLLRRRGQER
ncbi:MAG: class I SAM-dependent methyltransferase [Rhodospirillales bacterium]|nr:class I SAM-dependent methyltransferase [Rhodospirillales bacterium]